MRTADFQQVNKLDAIDGSVLSQDPKFSRHGGCEDQACVYCFGIAYECCTSNHVQGWPKFAARQLALVGRTGPHPRPEPCYSVSSCAARTLNAAGRCRVTLSRHGARPGAASTNYWEHTHLVRGT